LLQIAALGQRAATIEDPDVVQTEEAPREDVVSILVLAVHPPSEVQRQLLKAELEERKVPALAQLLLVAVDGPDRKGVDWGIDVVEVPFVGRHLAVGMEVMVAEEQPQLLLGEIDVYQR
jgi:hypothetical protein